MCLIFFKIHDRTFAVLVDHILLFDFRLAGVKGIFSSLRGELPANTFVAPSEATLQLLERPLFGDALSATRVLVSALFLPTAATFVGRFCFTSVENQLHRTLLVSTTGATAHKNFVPINLLNTCSRNQLAVL